MGLESVNFINDLVITNPTNLDGKEEGDDHLRNIKKALKATFPNLDSAVNTTPTELNRLVGLVAAILTVSGGNMTGYLNLKSANVAANATTCDVWVGGNQLSLTGGAVTFTDFADAPSADVWRFVRCNTTHVLTNNANITVHGVTATNLLQLAAGDLMIIHAITTSTFEVWVLKADGTSVAISGTPIGTVIQSAAFEAPEGFLEVGIVSSNISRTTYADLWGKIHKEATVTVSIASPGVVSWVGHGLQNGYPIRFKTTGALPTGLVVDTTYYVVNKATDTFQLSATVEGAAIDTSGGQSGVHTAICAPWGYGDNSTTFGLVAIPADYTITQVNDATASRGLGSSYVGEVISHNHIYTATVGVGGAPVEGGNNYAFGTYDTGLTGGPANLAAGVHMKHYIKF